MKPGRWQRVRVLLRRTGTVVGIGLCGATLLGRAPWFGWLGDQASQFPMQCAGGLAALSVAALFWKRWGQAAVYAGFVAINLAVLRPYLRPLLHTSPPPNRSTRPIRLLLSNVHYGNRHPERVRALIDRTDPDIIVLLEMPQPWEKELGDTLTERYPHRAICVYDARYRLALWTRLPLTHIRPEPLGVPQRPSLVAELVAPDGRPFTLIATHPSSPFRPAGARRRDRQLEAVARRAAEISERVVVVGDLNTAPWSRAVRRLAADGHLNDSSRVLGLTPSWPTYMPPLRIPLDQCLTSRDLHVICKERQESVGSDHFPVLFEVATTPHRL